MRINPDFILRNVAGEYVAIPTGDAARKLSGLISMNQTGKFLYDLLQTDRTPEELVSMMLDAYDIDEATAVADINEFLALMRKNNMLIDC